MLPRVIGIGAAATVVLVAAPGLVVKSLNPAPGVVVASIAQQKEQSKPEPAEAALKVTVTGRPGLLRVHAAGPPPARKTWLVDESGAHSAVVESASDCAHRDFRDTAAGWDEWCLALSGLDAGTTVTGTLAGDGTKLALTVTRRHSFWWWPFLVLVAGLLTPVATGGAMKWLRRHAGLNVVGRVIDRNERSRHLRVSDLRAWATEKERAGTAPGDLRRSVQRIVQGPRKIRAARKQLAAALARTALPADHPYVQAAATEARRRAVRVGDIVDDDGSPRIARASELLQGLTQLEADAAALEALEPLLEDLQGECEERAREAFAEATVRLANAGSPADVEALDDPIVHANAVLLAASTTPDCLRASTDTSTWLETLEPIQTRYVTDSVGSVPRATVVRALRDRDHEELARILHDVRALGQSPLELTGKSLWRDELYARGVTLAAFALVLGFAALTVEQAAYASNEAFASFWDGFTLFSAALASGAAATLLTLVDYWRPQPSE